MVLYFKIFWIAIFFFNLSFCKISNVDINLDITIISQVLHHIVDEFLLKEGIKFNIITLSYISMLQKDILSDFLLKSNEKFDLKLKHYHLDNPTIDYLMRSNIIFMRYIDDFEYIGNYLQILRYQNQPIKYFILTSKLTFDELKDSWIYNFFDEISIYSNEPFFYAYFITNEQDTVTLSTVEWFSPNRCSHPILNRLNVYEKKSMTWKFKLKNYEKFLQYHECELVLFLSIPLPNGIVQQVTGFSIINKNLTNFEIRGISTVIFEIASKVYNFTPGYQPGNMTYWWFRKIKRLPIMLVMINGTIKIPHVYLPLNSLQYSRTFFLMQRSNVISNIQIRMIFTPPEKYTAYEKFVLPFDIETWVLLAATFVLTFLSIFIINRLSKSTRNIVYGNEVDTPIWNVISIFFGISQTKLPNKNFSRFILVIFIYFCLIFRTCFQSKFFEFMTSEPRQLPPKTVQDLISRKYSIYAVNENTQYLTSSMEPQHWSVVYGINPIAFNELLLTQSQNSTAKIALCLDELLQNFIEKEKKLNLDWSQLETPVSIVHEAFESWGHSFYFRMFKILIDKLIPTGFMSFLVETHYTRSWKFEKPVEGPKVLEVKDLIFGFNIWLGCCMISIISFVAELILMRIVTRKPESIKFMKIHPTTITSLLNQPNFIEPKSELIELFRIKKKEDLEVSDLLDSINRIEEIAFGNSVSLD